MSYHETLNHFCDRATLRSFRGFPGGPVGRRLLANAEDMGSISGPEWSHMPRGNYWAGEPQLLKPKCLEPLLRNKQ